MMYVDDDVTNSKLAQAGERNFEQCSASDFDQGFWTVIGQGSQTRTESRGQNHGLHSAIFSNSRCRTTTLTTFWARKCLASCSARYTERCWPPVQPNETIRLWKPRR